MTESFESKFTKIGDVTLPYYAGTRVMMLPVIIGNEASIPDLLAGEWKATFHELSELANPAHKGKVGYLTIDEKIVQPAKTHRREGKHVDGVFQGSTGSWGGGGGWGSVGNGMITVASHPGCRAWNQTFIGRTGYEGECDHLADQCEGEGTLFGAGEVFWVDGLCVHESVAMTRPTPRQFVRLSLPSNAAWFEGYTENPLGVLPTGPILPRRSFMDA
jgi:hypothetical protein